MSAEPTHNSLSIVVPALNEEGSLAATLDELMEIVQEDFPDYEILVYDDGSSDQTGRIADEYATRFPHIRAMHHASPQGIGACYKEGLLLATKTHYMHVHGDNEIMGSSIRQILKSAPTADFIITYILDDSGRSKTRQDLSKCFTFLVNCLFGLKVRYYNGPNLVPVRFLKQIKVLTNGHAFMAEIIVRLTRKGYSYAEVGFQSRFRQKGKTKAFRIHNIVSVVRALLRLKFSLA